MQRTLHIAFLQNSLWQGYIGFKRNTQASRASSAHLDASVCSNVRGRRAFDVITRGEVAKLVLVARDFTPTMTGTENINHLVVGHI